MCNYECASIHDFLFFLKSFSDLVSEWDNKTNIFIVYNDDCHNTMDFSSIELHFIIIVCLKFLNGIENIDLIRILQKHYL